MNPIAKQLVDDFRRSDQRLVLAESCTGGLIASMLTDVPGASSMFAGGFVVYQNESKVGWIDVDAQTIQSHSAVCEEVARQMALGALSATRHADYVASITGHLGPEAPETLDGHVFIGVGNRDGVEVHRVILDAVDRGGRKIEAAMAVFQQIRQATLNSLK